MASQTPDPSRTHTAHALAAACLVLTLPIVARADWKPLPRVSQAIEVPRSAPERPADRPAVSSVSESAGTAVQPTASTPRQGVVVTRTLRRAADRRFSITTFRPLRIFGFPLLARAPVSKPNPTPQPASHP
jgi:hypothetical protein